MELNNTHPKLKFQVERIAFFTDAIFAIAITLMIIEVKPPHYHKGISNWDALLELLKLMPMFIGVLVSFFVIGIFWIRHHQLMRYVENYTPKFLWLNLILMFSIIFIPFTNALNSENTFSFSYVPIIVVNLNYILVAFLNYQLFKYALDPKNKICNTFPEHKSRLFRELKFPSFVYLSVILLSLIHPFIGPIGYALFSLEKLYMKGAKSTKEENTSQ